MKDESGYTIVELLTVLLIFGVVTGALTSLFVGATNSEVQSNRRFQSQQNARLALDKMRRETHCASSASVGVGGTSVTLNIGNSSCPGYPTVSWCAVGSGTRFRLYRASGSVCTSAGTKFADYLTSSALFTYSAPTTEVLARLHVRFPVNIKPAEAEESYTLEDELTLRNSARLII